MGGVSKTISKQWDSAGKVLSGKGNARDVFSAFTGMPTQDRAVPPPYNITQDPFTFDPAQTQADQQSIIDTGTKNADAQNVLGQKQYDQANQFITGDQATRDLARERLSQALINQNQATFKQGLPSTEEALNAQHLLNGSGLGQELARQQGNISTNIANQIGTLGAQDYTQASDQRAQALQGLQANQGQALGINQAASANSLSRGISLEDFARQAQLAKAIGAQAAPQVPNGKSTGTSAGLAGAGTGATIGSAVPGVGTAIGALIGGGLGYAGGSQTGKGGK